jgi:pyruvate kinase
MLFDHDEIRHLINNLDQIIGFISELENQYCEEIETCDPRYYQSARNLIHYLGLRHFDIRPLQEPLAKMGLSSLGRAESHTLANLRAIRYHLYHLLKVDWQFDHHCISLSQARHLLNRNTEALLGPLPPSRTTRIMVTLPSKAAYDSDLVEEMVNTGADLFRINCAKDSPEVWLKMITTVKTVGIKMDRKVTVLMDLGGPKLRTGKLKKNIPITAGQEIVILKSQVVGERAITDQMKGRNRLAYFSISLPEVFDDLKVGELVLIDDGEIAGRIISRNSDELRVLINFAEPGAKIKEDKGINFPESELKISGLTQKDRNDLAFIAKHADVVNMSFIRTRNDVKDLFDQIKNLGAENLGVMLKVETPQAFRNLPRILLTGMQHYPLGIMIARGDLAIESGWERTAEMQEELLWISEAAHIPNVWATQVLEKQAQLGLPSRAEITDAAMSTRSDCVMLNKGPHIVDTIRMLSDILERMERHQYKKSPLLRRLKMVDDLIPQID